MPRRLISTTVAAATLAFAAIATSCSKVVNDSQSSQNRIQIIPNTSPSVPQTVHSGDTVTIYGKNFPTDLSAITMTLNGKRCKLISANADSVRGLVPKMAGSGYVLLSSGADTVRGPEISYNYLVTVTTIAGTGGVGTSNGAALGSSFNCPWGITADANGDLYIADSYNRLLRKYTAASSTISQITIPGTLSFYSPYNIALDRATHNLYVTDFNVHLAKVYPDGTFKIIYNDSMPNAGIALGPDRFLYMSNNTNGNVIRLDTNGNQRTRFGNNIVTPRNLIFDRDGNLYIGAYGIYKITPQGVQSQIFFDNQWQGWEIARDTLGNIYEADHFNNNLRMIEASSGKVFTIAGSGSPQDTDGVGLGASFNGPMGLCIDDKGVLYMTTYNFNTTGGNEVRKITLQ
jgi:hypothetical protein